MGHLCEVLLTIMLFVFLSFALCVLYQSSVKSAAVGGGSNIGSSVSSGIGVLLHVCRWCMGLLAQTTLRAVIFSDVVETPTL